MEQRPLRLGDIVDDYCTRERRVTNHAVVALVEDAIRQTRCTTCDTEHAYRGAKEPRLRKKPPATELYDQVLADVTAAAPETVPQPPTEEAVEAAPTESAPPESNGDAGSPTDPQADQVWSAHRRLIRATLPRTENEPPAPRPIPEFTMHQRPQTRGGRGFRFGGGGGGNGQGNGQGNGSSPNGFGNGQPGQQPGKPGRRRRKRSR